MTDQGNHVSGQAPAQESTTSQGVQPSGKELSPDIIQLLRGEIKNALGEFSREQQSQRDKQEARILGRVQELKATFSALNGGQELTADQLSELHKVAAKQVAEQPEQEHAQQTSSQPKAAQPEAQAEMGPVEKLILKKMEKAGITIEDGDPEIAMLQNINAEDLDDLKDKIDTAINAKRARLAKPSSTPEAAVARVSAAAGGPALPGNPIADINDPTVLLTMGLTRKK